MTTILLFDDSLFMLKYLEKILQSQEKPVNIFRSQTFQDSVDIVQSHAIDIAFIDLRMPGKNGVDFVYYLNSQPKFTKIKKVIVTETGKNTLLSSSLKNEVDAFIHKEDVLKDYETLVEHIH